MKLGLDNCYRLNTALGYPTNRFLSIHIAGTNGKGSVTKKIAAALQDAGHRVGLYTSPHISCFRERIRINNQMIAEKDVEELLLTLFSLTEAHRIPATFFEITTALAFAYFAQQKVDIAVIETGLGGRLDATNLIIPKLSIITSVSLEHTEILGNTIEEIAKEKGGIIKPNIPVIIGPHVPFALIKNIADTKNSRCISIQGPFATFEHENCAIARQALEMLLIPEKSIENGLKTQLPCRFELFSGHKYPIILDVAHNPDGLIRLFEMLRESYPDKTFRVICGLSKNKDLTSCLSIINSNANFVHLVEAPNGRGAAPSQLYERLMDLETAVPNRIYIHDNIGDSIAKAKESNDIIVICGTFFIMSAARAALGIIEECDAIDMNERKIMGA